MSNHDSYSDSLVALYCLSSDSQHNPRLRSGAGRSIVTTAPRIVWLPEMGEERGELGEG